MSASTGRPNPVNFRSPEVEFFIIEQSFGAPSKAFQSAQILSLHKSQIVVIRIIANAIRLFHIPVARIVAPSRRSTSYRSTEFPSPRAE
jgi:hypothetical protein